MKTERVIWGLILLFVGGVLLLDNFGVIDFHWLNIWRFWPLVLIVFGVKMLFSEADSAKAGILAISVTVAALAFLGYQGTHYEDSRQAWLWPKEYNNSREKKLRSVYSASITPGFSHAEVNVSGGATRFVIADSTSELFFAEVENSKRNYTLFKTVRDSVDVLNFKMIGKNDWDLEHSAQSKAVIKLNPMPVWDINLKFGAGKAVVDLQAFKVRKFSFEGGATSLLLTLGAPQKKSEINVETGASKVKILVPEAAPCKIRFESGLSSNNFREFNKQSDGTYTSQNFNSSENHYIINLQGGISKFEVERY